MRILGLRKDREHFACFWAAARVRTYRESQVQVLYYLYGSMVKPDTGLISTVWYKLVEAVERLTNLVNKRCIQGEQSQNEQYTTGR